MTRDEFCKCHWEYYLVLEKDFLEIERYVAFELGDNFLYTNNSATDNGNSECFSNEFIKQYQAICSEVDVILKSICKEINTNATANDMERYSDEILNIWSGIVQQKVKLKDIELQPFSNWSRQPHYKSPDWWTPYNKVKHNRLANYKKANLKNTINALAGLYILEQYFAKYIGDRDDVKDVPNDVSKLFEMINFTTKDTVVGKDCYLITAEDIDNMFNSV